MSISLKYVFPIANTSDVCLAQTTGAAGSFILNGNLANLVTNTVPFITRGYSRSISFTSVGDISARTFTITGIQNGVIVNENIAGPNNDTVYSVQVYDVITSITVNGAVGTAVSVGTGYLGFFPLIGINLEKDSAIVNYSLSTARLTAAAINTTIFNTNDNIFQNGATFLNNIANNHNLFSIKGSSADDQLFLPTANIVVCRSILIQINGVVGQIANSIQMNFIQV